MFPYSLGFNPTILKRYTNPQFWSELSASKFFFKIYFDKNIIFLIKLWRPITIYLNIKENHYTILIPYRILQGRACGMKLCRAITRKRLMLLSYIIANAITMPSFLALWLPTAYLNMKFGPKLRIFIFQLSYKRQCEDSFNYIYAKFSKNLVS